MEEVEKNALIPSVTAEFKTVEDLALYFGINLDQARRLVREHKEVLAPYKVSREYRFELGSFDRLKEHLKSREVNNNG